MPETKHFLKYFRSGDITTLNIHAIVHSTNERLNDKSPETELIYSKGGKELVDDIKNNVKGKLTMNTNPVT